MNLAAALILLVSCLNFGDWSNWKKYQSTMLYVSLANATYVLLVGDRLLWEFHSPIITLKQLDILYTLIIMPSMTFLYLSNYPYKEDWKKKMLYFLYYVVASSIYELLMWYEGNIMYYHGWTIGWSVLFYTLMFLLMIINNKTPVLSYVISLVAALYFLWQFDYFVEGQW